MDRSRLAMRDEGFTLTEVLVAFAILSLSIILGFRAFGSGVWQVAQVEDDLSAIGEIEEAINVAEIYKSTAPAPGTANFMEFPLRSEKSEWSPLIPHLVIVNKPNGKDNPIETIIVRHKNDE